MLTMLMDEAAPEGGSEIDLDDPATKMQVNVGDMGNEPKLTKEQTRFNPDGAKEMDEAAMSMKRDANEEVENAAMNEVERKEVDEAVAKEDAAKREVERKKAERIEAERIEAERIEAERIEAEKIEAERIEAEKKLVTGVNVEKLAQNIGERIDDDREPVNDNNEDDFIPTKEKNDAEDNKERTSTLKALLYLAMLTGVAWFVYEVFQVVMANGTGCFVGGVKLPKSECPVPLQHPLGSEFFTIPSDGLECPTCPPMWMCLMPAKPVPRNAPCTGPPATCCPGVPPSSISGASVCGKVSSTDAMNVTHENKSSATLPVGSTIDTTCSSPRACSTQGGCWILHKPICKQYPNACKDPNDCKSTHGLTWGNGWGCVVKGAQTGMSCARSASACKQECKTRGLPSSDCVWAQSAHKSMSSLAAVGQIGKDIAKIPGKLFCDMLGGCGAIQWIVIVIVGIVVLFVILRLWYSRRHTQVAPVPAT